MQGLGAKIALVGSALSSVVNAVDNFESGYSEVRSSIF
jgi:hypothetical protein